jgi:hypothetical protein
MQDFRGQKALTSRLEPPRTSSLSPYWAAIEPPWTLNLSLCFQPQTVNLSLYSPRAQGTIVTSQMLVYHKATGHSASGFGGASPSRAQGGFGGGATGWRTR